MKRARQGLQSNVYDAYSCVLYELLQQTQNVKRVCDTMEFYTGCAGDCEFRRRFFIHDWDKVKNWYTVKHAQVGCLYDNDKYYWDVVYFLCYNYGHLINEKEEICEKCKDIDINVECDKQ